jgi:putative CocE/NonD family hydrolase
LMSRLQQRCEHVQNRRLTVSTRAHILLLLSAILSAQDAAAPPKQTFQVPMRDGVHLATDVYGAEPGVRKPVLLLRTPYDKNRAAATALRQVAAGYVAVLQDARGAFASEGHYIHHNNDDQDGFDTLEWISRQPWSNGHAGMWGSSHPGAVQWLAAADRSTGLDVIAPSAASPSLYRTAYLGGALRLALIGGAGPLIDRPPSGLRTPENLAPLYLRQPLADLDNTIGWPMPWLRGVVTHPRLDGFWSRQHATPRVENLDIAAQHIVGYYDFLCRETVASFQRLSRSSATARARMNQQLILGPWDHSTLGKEIEGGVNFGPEARLDVTAENLQWFDRFLKPSITSKSDFPKVRYFLMGRNTWRTAPDWPPPDAQETAFYLHSEGKANTRKGDGSLTMRSPSATEAQDTFEADPRNPVPVEPPSSDPPSRSSMFRPVDRSALQDRADVLVYTGEPARQELIVAGSPRAELWVSADTPDADWVVKLTIVAPDGTARAVSEGILRSSFRESETNPSLIEPGRIYPMKIDLGHTAFALAPGQFLRVEIAASCFPMYDRNPNTGEGPFAITERQARQSIYHSAQTPSRIILPVLTAPDFEKNVHEDGQRVPRRAPRTSKDI